MMRRQPLASWSRRLVLLMLGVALMTVVTHRTQASGPVERHQAALLIDSGDPAETGHLADVLEHRGGFTVTRLSMLSGAALQMEVDRWVNAVHKRPEPCRRMVVYYRGPLVLSDGRGLLLPGDNRNAGSTPTSGVDLRELITGLKRQRGGSLAALLLDVSTDAPEGDIQQRLQTATGQTISDEMPVAILACTRSSHMPEEAARFARPFHECLASGLRGEAQPVPMSGTSAGIELGQLHHYLADRQTDSSRLWLSTSHDSARSAHICPVREKKLDELIEDAAESIAAQLHLHRVEIALIPDLMIPHHQSSQPEIPGQDYGPLARYVQTKLKSQLSARSYAAWSIADGVWIRDILQRHQVGPDSIRSPKLKNLLSEVKQQAGPGRVAVVIGRLEHDRGERLALRCDLWSDQPGHFPHVRGTAILNPSEWAMIGHSAINEEVRRRHAGPPLAPGETPVASGVSSTHAVAQPAVRKEVAAQKPRESRPLPLLDYFDEQDLQRVGAEISRLEQQAQRPHPLKDSAFPWRISLRVQERERPLSWSKDGTEAWVTMNRGEEYSVRIENRDGRPVFLRLLVDGLNTLPDTPLLKTEGRFEIAVKDPQGQRQPAQYVNLTNARAWFCEPDSVYEVRGFFTSVPNGAQASLATFEVTDAQSSEAARKGYFKDIGLITAAFYVPMKKPLNMAPVSGMGTKLGRTQQETVESYSGEQVPGELLGVLHIRYGVPSGRSEDAETTASVN